MTLLALSAGDTALIVLAAFWGLLVLALCVVLLNTFRVLESTKMTIDTMREETVPLLREVKGSVERANRELDRVDTMLVSATEIVGRVEKLSGLVEQAAASPLSRSSAWAPASARASRRRGAARREARLLGRPRPGRRGDGRDPREPLDPQAGHARRPADDRPRGEGRSHRPVEARLGVDPGGQAGDGRARGRAAARTPGSMAATEPPVDSPGGRQPHP